MRDTGASVLLRIAVPPGDEVPAGQAIAAVPGFCGSDEGLGEVKGYNLFNICIDYLYVVCFNDKSHQN